MISTLIYFNNFILSEKSSLLSTKAYYKEFLQLFLLKDLVCLSVQTSNFCKRKKKGSKYKPVTFNAKSLAGFWTKKRSKIKEKEKDRWTRIQTRVVTEKKKRKREVDQLRRSVFVKSPMGSQSTDSFFWLSSDHTIILPFFFFFYSCKKGWWVWILRGK